MMSVRISKERSDLTDLVSAAIKTTFHTRSPGGVERCIDVLNQLTSLSLSVNDLRLSDSIVKLETLRRHRNRKIRKESQALFQSWTKTIYTQGRDDTFKACLTKSRLKLKKHVLTRCSKLKTTDERISLTREAKEIKKENDFVELKKKENQRSLTHEAVKIKKGTNINLLELNKNQDYMSLTQETKKIEKETKTDLKTFDLKKRSDDCKAVTTKKIAGNRKICSVTTTALPQRSRHNIKDKDGQVTTKTLIPPPRRAASCQNVPRRPVYTMKQQPTGLVKDSRNPKIPALKTKTEEELKKKKTELVELFEDAKKAADVANAKGILLGKPEASRCVEALSLLMRINIAPKPKEPRRMMERLEGLTNHKDRKVSNAASSLLHLWRQRNKYHQRKEKATKTFSNNPRKTH